MSFKDRLAAFEGKKDERPQEKTTTTKFRVTETSAKLKAMGPTSGADEEPSSLVSTKSPNWKSKVKIKKDGDGVEGKNTTTETKVIGVGTPTGKRTGGGKGIAKFLQKAKEVQTMASVSNSGFRSAAMGGSRNTRMHKSGGAQPQPALEASASTAPTPSTLLGKVGRKGPSSPSTSGQSDAMEAIRLAREAMGASGGPEQGKEESKDQVVNAAASQLAMTEEAESPSVVDPPKATAASESMSVIVPIERSEGETTVILAEAHTANLPSGGEENPSSVPSGGGIEVQNESNSGFLSRSSSLTSRDGLGSGEAAAIEDETTATTGPPRLAGLVRRASKNFGELSSAAAGRGSSAGGAVLAAAPQSAGGVDSATEASASPSSAVEPVLPPSQSGGLKARFKGAAQKVVESADATSEAQVSPSKSAFRPSLKAGQQAMREIERKQWLARKWQTDIDKQRDGVKAAQDRARSEKTSDMSVAMDKLRSIMNPLAPSPDQLAILESRADGLLNRIKDQLAAAATGTSGPDGEDGGEEETLYCGLQENSGSGACIDPAASHHKHAGRGKELISRIILKDPPEENPSSDGHRDSTVASNINALFDTDEADGFGGVQGDGATAVMAAVGWRGSAMTVERLADDAEELATSRCMSGHPASFASLCAVLVIDGYGNVTTVGGWEEKFISLSDARIWSAAYFSVDSGTISTAGAAGRFNCIADLRSAGVSVVFEECAHTSTGFAIVIRTLSTFTIKIAPKRFKTLLEWGAVLHQAINELPSLVPPPATATTLPLASSGYHDSAVGDDGLFSTSSSDYFPASLRDVSGSDFSGQGGLQSHETEMAARSWVENYRRQRKERGRQDPSPWPPAF